MPTSLPVEHSDAPDIWVENYLDTGFWAVWQGDKVLVVTADKERAESIRACLLGPERA